MNPKLKCVKSFYDNFEISTFNNAVKDEKTPAMIEDFFERDLELTEKILKTEGIANKKILEVGCGEGRILKLLSRKCKFVTGIDFSQEQLRKAETNMADTGIKLRCMDASHMDFNENEFNLSLCLNNSLGNMPGVEEMAINEMTRVTKVGGKIIVRVFSEEILKSQIRNYHRLGFTGIKDINGAIITREGLYSRRFSKADLRKIFSGAGLEVEIKQDGSGGLLAIAIKEV